MSIAEQPEAPAPTDAHARIAELEAQVARLTELIEPRSVVRSSPEVEAPQVALTPDRHDPVEAPHTGSRRHLLRLAAGAAAGGTAVALAGGSRPVAAVDGDPVRVGQETTQGDSGRTTTVVKYENTESPQIGSEGANILTVRDEPSGSPGFDPSQSSRPSAVAGYGYSVVENGVYGYVQTNGRGVFGFGDGAASTGVAAFGRRAALELLPNGTPPPQRGDLHVVGEVVVDQSGDLWYCVVGGPPGTWRKMAGVETAGTLHPVTPFRVFDSRREGDGALAGDETRTVSVADARDVTDYSVTQSDAVPSGATAVAGNVVVIGTSDTGFLSINPGGVTEITASSVNWVSGLNVGNAGLFTLNDSRQLEIVMGPGNGCHVTIDVTGYYL